MLPSQVEASVAKSPSVTIDPNGNRASLTYRKADGTNIASTTYTYDRLNRLRELNTTGPLGTIQRYIFTLAPAGNRTRIEEHDGTVRDYTYDDLYRLTGETVSGGPIVYSKVFTYDPVGNRLRQVTTGFGAGDVSYTYDTRDRLLTEGPQAYSWDDNGNLISKDNEATYFWDFENRLIRVEKADGSVIEHQYDPDGNRVETKTTPAGGGTTVINYLVDTSGSLSHVVAETNAAGDLVAYYVRADDLLAVMRPDGGGFISRFYHADGLGSIRRLTDVNGNITDGYSYSAFGELLAHTGSDPQPYTFAGEPYDPNIGFYYNRARWLDPRVGRFASVDPLDPLDPSVGLEFDPRSFHRYLYTGANPVDHVDPSGLFFGGVAEFSIAASIQNTLSSIQSTIGFAIIDQIEYGGVAGYKTLAIGGIGVLFSALAAGIAIGVKGAAAVGRFRAATRFVSGVKVKSFGKVIAEGTADLEPTLERIARGIKGPHPNDGAIFGNIQKRLPIKSDPKYYQEFVHPTPGFAGAGPQRLVVGKGGEVFYSPDHYLTFIPLN
jgi:RHS repeat-associated protein